VGIKLKLNKMARRKSKCVDCGNPCTMGALRCLPCSNKHNGKGINKNYCIDCGRRIFPYRSKRCLSCSTKGKRNGLWKGNEVGYLSLHEWIKRYKPKPELCGDCKKKKPMDLANISGKYRRDVNDFEWLCRSCHMKKDGRMKNLKQNQNKNICFKCGEEKEDNEVSLQYGKLICSNCLPNFKKKSKEEIKDKLENIF